MYRLHEGCLIKRQTRRVIRGLLPKYLGPAAATALFSLCWAVKRECVKVVVYRHHYVLAAIELIGHR